VKPELRPQLQQDLEASHKYPSVSHLEIKSELNTSKLIREFSQAITNTRTTARTMLQQSLPMQSAYNHVPPRACLEYCGKTICKNADGLTDCNVNLSII